MKYFTDALRGIDPKHKVQHALELRDSIEVFQATDYVRFLHKMMPVFLKVLGEGQPIFVSTVPEQVHTTPPLQSDVKGLESTCMFIGNPPSITNKRPFERLCKGYYGPPYAYSKNRQ